MNNWRMLLLQSDSTSVVQAFKNIDIILICLRNRWHNCLYLGLQTVSSHIFCEENCRVDKLAAHGHTVSDTNWLSSLPHSLLADFSRYRNGLPNFCFPETVFIYCFLLYVFWPSEGFGLSSLMHIYIVDNIQWELRRGANLVKISMFLLDGLPISWLMKKKIKY